MYRSKATKLLVNTERCPKINRSAETKDSPLGLNPNSFSPLNESWHSGIEKFPSLAIHKLSGTNLLPKKTSRMERVTTDPNDVHIKKYGKVHVFVANSTAGPMKIKNEDMVRVVLNIKRPENFINEIWPQSSYFGLYDGQGGKTCAAYLKEHLHTHVFTDEDFPYKPKSALTNAYLKADKNYSKYAEEINDFSGSCALVTLIIGNKCFVANTGDSKAILSTNFGQNVLALSKEHKPFNETEHMRILQNGGELKSNYIIDSCGFKIEKGSYKIIPGNIPISRSLGNIHAKLEKFGGNSKIHIPNPEIKSFKIRQNYDFILMCSFGILEKFSIKETVELVWRGIRECEVENMQEKIANGMSVLMNEAVSLRCEDNITVVLIGFKNLAESFNKVSKNVCL